MPRLPLRALALVVLTLLAPLALAVPAAGQHSFGPATVRLGLFSDTVYPSGSFYVSPAGVLPPSTPRDLPPSLWVFGDGSQAFDTGTVPVPAIMPRTAQLWGDGRHASASYRFGPFYYEEELEFSESGARATVTIYNEGRFPAAPSATFLALYGNRSLGTPVTGVISNEARLNGSTVPSVSVFTAPVRGPDLAIQVTRGPSPDTIDLVRGAAAILQPRTYEPNATRGLNGDGAVRMHWQFRAVNPFDWVRIEVTIGASLVPVPGPVDLQISDLRLGEPIGYVGRTRTVSFVITNPDPEEQRPVSVTLLTLDNRGAPMANDRRTFLLEPLVNLEFRWSWIPRLACESELRIYLRFADDRVLDDNRAAFSLLTQPPRYWPQIRFHDGSTIRRVDASPGATITAQLTVTNIGTATDLIGLTTRDPPLGWTITLSWNHRMLQPGESAGVELTVVTSDATSWESDGVPVFASSVYDGTTDHATLFIVFSQPPISGPRPGDADGDGIPDEEDPDTPPMTPGNQPGSHIPVGPGTNPRGGSPGEPLPSSGGVMIAPGAALLGLAAILLLAVLLILSFRRGRTESSLEKILRRLYRNLYKLDTSDEIRRAIYTAYQEMCRGLERYGVSREDTRTAAEFEREVRFYVPVSKKDLHGLSMLFQEARYSDHKFTIEDRDRALAFLKAILTDLESQATTFEEEPTLMGRIFRRGAPSKAPPALPSRGEPAPVSEALEEIRRSPPPALAGPGASSPPVDWEEDPVESEAFPDRIAEGAPGRAKGRTSADGRTTRLQPRRGPALSGGPTTRGRKGTQSEDPGPERPSGSPRK